MTNPSMNDCKEYGLLIDAKERYENTSKRWKNAWWDVICYIYDHFEKWHDKFQINKITKTIIALIKKRKGRTREDIKELVPVHFARGTKLCYLFKFYDENGNIVYTKVGTTERTIRERLGEDLLDYRKTVNISFATVESVFDTGSLNPEGAQDYVKAIWMHKYNEYYKRNDRFTCDIPTNYFNELVSGYLAG